MKHAHEPTIDALWRALDASIAAARTQGVQVAVIETILALLAVTVLGVILACAYGGVALIQRSLREPEPSTQPPAAWIANSGPVKPVLHDPTLLGRLFMFLDGFGVIAAPFFALYEVWEYLSNLPRGHWPRGEWTRAARENATATPAVQSRSPPSGSEAPFPAPRHTDLGFRRCRSSSACPS
jgi:hypothetical protein